MLSECPEASGRPRVPRSLPSRCTRALVLACSQVGLPPEIVFGDQEATLYQNLRFVNSDFNEDCH